MAQALDARLARGEAPDPADPADIDAAEAWFGLLLDGAFAGVAAAAGPEIAALAGPIRDAAARLGFLPPDVARKLDLYWRSGDPKLMLFAAEADAPRRDFTAGIAGRRDAAPDVIREPQMPLTGRETFRAKVVGFIGCDETLLYNGEELFGISLEQAVSILGREPDGEPEVEEMYDDTVQTIAYFEALGLDLWFLEGVSVYAGLDDGDYEEDEGG